jgi:hypothetical protein
MACQSVYAQAPGAGTTAMISSGQGDGALGSHLPHCMCLKCFCFWIVIVAGILLIMHQRRQ